MAQTKRKRRTKHRGNAVGMIEVRGRTGRKPTENERGSASTKQTAAARREERMSRPPSWRSAFNRSVVAAAAFALLLIVLFKRPVLGSVVFGVIMLGLYTPLSFYMDSYLYRRRQRMKGASR